MEDYWAGRAAREKWSLQEKMSFGRKFAEAKERQGSELLNLYRQGTERDRLIIEVYSAMAGSGHSTSYISPQKTRDLIARIAPMTEDEIREELRRADEAREKKIQAHRKRQETLWLYEKLTPEERDQRRLEAQRENARNYKKANKVNAQVRRRWRERKEQESIPLI